MLVIKMSVNSPGFKVLRYAGIIKERLSYMLPPPLIGPALGGFFFLLT